MIGDPIDSRNTFSNPFEEINANVLDLKKLVEYWCNPFELGLLSNFNELKFCTSKLPIILQGSRGSGKTTILKYYTFNAQAERVNMLNEKSLLERIKKEGEIGFYYRCEESFVATFIAIFQKVSPEHWTNLFECYIELIFSQQIIEMLSNLRSRQEINEISTATIKEILSQIDMKGHEECCSIDSLYSIVHEWIVYFEQYKNRAMFSTEQFKPEKIVNFCSLSKAIVKAIKQTIPAFKDVLFVFMIDEYENLNAELQKRVNTIIKFIGPEISLRVGRRSEGLFTTETINDIEYLRENHDYYLATLDEERDIQKIRKYFMEVANLRFQRVYHKLPKNIEWNIINMLGDMEDLLEECKQVCGHQKKHIEIILKQNSVLIHNDDLLRKIIKRITNDNNPIAETLNALWVIRTKDRDYLKAADYAVEAMRAFFSGEKQPGVQKYKSDYSNKYRYAITVFICSVYKKEKLYYGFNALCHLSNGNVRTFINFCQYIINEALFYDAAAFLRSGEVSKSIQSHAIRSFSKSEFNNICSVVNTGDKIRRFVLNVGNSFAIFHKDRKIRYPETTQFAIETTSLACEDSEILKVAGSWAIINRKSKVQRTSAGVNERTELYYINKSFSPLFGISYRTRGGVNLQLDYIDVHNMFNMDSYFPTAVKRLADGSDIKEEITDKEGFEQMSLFKMESNDE